VKVLAKLLFQPVPLLCRSLATSFSFLDAKLLFSNVFLEFELTAS